MIQREAKDVEMMRTSQVAELLGVDRQTILARVRDGKLKAYQLAGVGNYMFKRDDIMSIYKSTPLGDSYNDIRGGGNPLNTPEKKKGPSPEVSNE